MIITGGSLKESKDALAVAKQYGKPVFPNALATFPLNCNFHLGLYATVGCHPTRSSEFDKNPDGPEKYLEALDTLIGENLTGIGRVVAIGECGLGAFKFVLLFGVTGSAETSGQTTIAYTSHLRKYRGDILVSATCVRNVLLRMNALFRLAGSQLSLAKKHHLPLFLHSRAAHTDLVRILREEGFGENGGRSVGANGGVVHSFTGTPDEARDIVSYASVDYDHP